MSKRFEGAKLKVEKKPIDLSAALSMAKDLSSVKFNESVDLAVRLGVNPKYSDQMVRGAVVLPHGTGKKVRVLVFAKGEKEKEAQEAGADFIGSEDLVERINQGWLDFDATVSTPDLMGLVGKLGKILGPRGLRPNPKIGTVTFDVSRAVKDIRLGKVEYKVEKAGIVHAPIGKVAFEAQQLFENALAVLESIVKAKPSTSKGTYLKNITVSSTMGPAIPVDLTTLNKLLDQG
jgi:large subunit ribosomal protein L1